MLAAAQTLGWPDSKPLGQFTLHPRRHGGIGLTPPLSAPSWCLPAFATALALSAAASTQDSSASKSTLPVERVSTPVFVVLLVLLPSVVAAHRPILNRGFHKRQLGESM